MELTVKTFEALTLHELYGILRLRTDIFVVEQTCPYPELDGRDEKALHVFLRDEAGIHACLRILEKGAALEEVALGRLAVRQEKRRQGLATRILAEGIRLAQERLGAEHIQLEAQVYARSLYQQAGFRQISEEFLEDGIPHILMELDCANR